MPGPRRNCASRHRAEEDEQDDQQIRGERQTEGVGQSETLEGMATD